MAFRVGSVINLLAAICIGVLTGLLASGFNGVIMAGVSFTNRLLLSSSVFYILLPLVAALMTGFIYQKGFNEDRSGFGVVQVFVEMTFVKTFLMKPLNVFWRLLASLITLICGLTAGRFGPIVHLGASIGSNVAYLFKADDDQIRMLIGCGAAGAIATVFNLPFFGALFVLEVLFRERNFSFLAPLLLSSVIANQVGVALLGNRLPLAIRFVGSGEWQSAIGVYLVLGVLTGLIAILYMVSIESATQIFEKFKSIWLRLFIAASIVGVVAFFFHDQFEIHSNTTNRILSGEITVGILFVLVFVRILTTALTLGSGFLGGNFYPGVTIGAATGVLFWQMLSQLGMSAQPKVEMGLLGIVGMLSGYLHAPLACVVLCLEISKDTKLIIPGMIVSAVSLAVSHSFYGHDIFSKPLGRVLSQYARRQNEK